jgi:pentose-5-phosphate-3-epimerase
MDENLISNIVPSKPFKNYEDISSLAAQAKGRLERIQVDICDGDYVKNVSWPFTEYSKEEFSLMANGRKFADGDLHMPEPYDINYTADLMCTNPEKYIDTLVQYGFDEIIIHWRSIRDSKQQQELLLNLGTSYLLSLIIAVDIKTEIEEVKNFFKKYARNYTQLYGIQVMGILNIGMQGQKFEGKSLEIVKEFRNFFDKELVFDEQGKKWEDGKYYEILFDGGIEEDNFQQIKNAGVDVFCVGHLLTEGSFVDNLKFIKML